VGMVSNFVMDYMHLVYLGVMRKIISLWLRGPLKTRLGPLSRKEIDEKMMSCMSYVIRTNIPFSSSSKFILSLIKVTDIQIVFKLTKTKVIMPKSCMLFVWKRA
jgi:hypothetical protein